MPEAATACCSPVRAWLWVQEITTEALNDEQGAQRLLPDVISHYLNVVRQVRPR